MKNKKVQDLGRILEILVNRISSQLQFSPLLQTNKLKNIKVSMLAIILLCHLHNLLLRKHPDAVHLLSHFIELNVSSPAQTGEFPLVSCTVAFVRLTHTLVWVFDEGD